MSSVNIYLVRHGQTVFNAKGIVQGAADAPLTQMGIDQAINLGKAIRDKEFDAIYSSDLRRAFETALYIINENHKPLKVKTMKEFREFDFGLYEGDPMLNFWENNARKYGYDLEHIMQNDFMSRYNYIYHEIDNPIGEKNADFKKRIYDGMETISKEALEKGQKNIMVVAHGVTIMGIIHLLIEDYKFSGFISNAGVTKFTYDGANFKNIYISKEL